CCFQHFTQAVLAYWYSFLNKCNAPQGGETVPQKSRAEYFRERRKILKQFSVLSQRERVEALEAKLKAQGKTKVQWFEEKVDEELGK
ncbi:hypothetical protein, partial [uncultured Oscillibacter sp.]|uniref:hypothetical protein n=1 Tax=uncultured Oscillibacter sp. TaxID=876091 RepID=UPI0025F9443F